MFEKYTCPECRGFGVIMSDDDDGSNAIKCWYCDGCGLASDDDTEEHFYYYEDI